MKKKTIKYFFLAFFSILTAFPLLAEEPEKKDTTINFPWSQELSYYQTTGSFLSVGEAELEKRTLGDLRNRLTGLLPGFEVTEKAGGLWATGNLGTGVMSSDQLNILFRGSSSVICIVDDIRVPFNQLVLDPNQVESITVLSDVLDRAKFGPMASDGALYIKTKKGKYNTPMQIHMNVESGVSMTDRIVEWVNGVDYAMLNNKARAESNYTQLYSNEAINSYAQGNAYDLKYPVVDYKSLMLKNSMPVSGIGFNVYGGGNNVKYNVSMNGLNAGDIIVSPATDFNKINLSASVTARIGNYVEASTDFSSLLSFRRQGSTEWFDYRIVPAIMFPLSFGTSEGGEGEEGLSNNTIYAVTRSFPNNYYAKMKEGGFMTTRNRSGMINTSIDVDLSWLIKGLKSRTLVGLTNFFQTTIGKSNDYLAYYYDPIIGKDVISGHKGEKASSKSIFSNFTSQSLSMYERLSYHWVNDNHKILSGITYSIYNASQKDHAYYQRQMYAIGDFSYSYADKYVVEAAAQYVGSSRFDSENRFAFFPSVGMAWVLSNEEFMKDVSWADNVKLRMQAGVMGQSNVFSAPYLYRSDYSFGNGILYGPNNNQNTWFGTESWRSQKTTINRLANPELGWAKIFQLDAGIDVDVLRSISISGNYYRRKSIGSIADVSAAFPDFYGLTAVNLYNNYTSDILHGFDVSLHFRDRFGDFRVSAGLSISSWKTVYNKIVNDNYIYDYQKRTGTDTDAYWGYQCIGKYQSQEQIDELPSYTSGLKIGDLIYKDVNEDDRIDNNDKVIVGNTSPNLRYAVSLGCGFKNIDFQIVGTGRAFYQIPMTNEYFHNGWGDGNYSVFVRDNIGGAYPRIDYIKSENNFIESDFWLRDGDWFKIQDAEIAYTHNCERGEIFGLSCIRFSLRGQNLLTLSGIKEVDPESINAGVSGYPLFKTITAGLKLSF